MTIKLAIAVTSIFWDIDPYDKDIDDRLPIADYLYLRDLPDDLDIEDYDQVAALVADQLSDDFGYTVLDFEYHIDEIIKTDDTIAA
jgi:hypothetical protein